MATHCWEVSIVVDESARRVVARDVDRAGLGAAMAECQRLLDTGEYLHPPFRTGAMLVQREDQTAEARREKWEADFYDLDRRGYKRRRFKRPAIEKEWEAWAKAERKAEREASKMSNDTYVQKARG